MIAGARARNPSGVFPDWYLRSKIHAMDRRFSRRRPKGRSSLASRPDPAIMPLALRRQPHGESIAIADWGLKRPRGLWHRAHPFQEKWCLAVPAEFRSARG